MARNWEKITMMVDIQGLNQGEIQKKKQQLQWIANEISNILLLDGDSILDKAPVLIANKNLVVRMYDTIKSGNIITNGKLNKLNLMSTMAKLITMGDQIKK